MPPFRYEPFVNPMAGTIGSMLQHQADPQANAAVQIAQAQARAAEIGGQAWAGAAQNIGQNVSGAIAQATDPKRQIENMQLQAFKSQQMGRSVLARSIQQRTKMNTETGVPETDHQAVANDVSAAGFPDQAEAWLKTASSNAENLDKLKQLTAAHAKQQLETIGELAFNAKSAEDFTAGVLLAGQAGQLDTGNAQKFLDQLKPGEWQQAQKTYLPFSPSYAKQQAEMAKPTVVGKNAVLTTPDRAAAGQPPLASNLVPEQPTEASLAADLSSPDPTVRARAEKAMAALKPPPAQDEFQSFKGSYAKSLGAPSWDTLTPAQQINGFSAFTKAKQDPAVAAQAAATRELANQARQARLDAAATKAEPLDVSPDVKTTVTGKKYLDLSTYTGDARNKARVAAAGEGAVTVGKEEADAVTSIDTARLNQQALLNQIKDSLPTGPGGRIIAAPGTALSKVFQTNEQKSAFNTWRGTAVETMRAIAGSKGLRFNKDLLEQSIASDIPTLNDTLAVAQQKLKNINLQLDNVENSILVHDRSRLTPPDVVTPPPVLTPGLQGLANR
jgi:hypothetical protein